MKKEKKLVIENKKLNIRKVRPEDHISIVAIADKKTIEFQVSYANITDEEKIELEYAYNMDYLPINLIVQEYEGQEKPVSFSSDSTFLELYVVNPDGLYKWEHIRLVKHKFESGYMIHVVLTLIPDGEKFNRRRGVRIDIDRRMQLEQGESKMDVLVREMSYCGFSFIKLSDEVIDFSKPFLLHLIDYDVKNNKTYLVGKFAGKVHRQRPDENGVMIYGCILAERHAEYLQKYVATKQLQNINKKAEYKAVEKNSESKFWKEEVVDALNGLNVERNY